MRIIYEAFDGKTFDKQWECENYEYMLFHPHLLTICFYDKNDKLCYITKELIEDVDSKIDLIYHNTEKVEIHTKEEFQDFIELSKDCGWCEFYDYITSPGLWIRHEDEYMNPIWEKVE